MHIHSPVHEALSASDCEDNCIQIVHWKRLHNHRFGTLAPIRVHIGVFLMSRGFVVDTAGVFGSELEKGICREITKKVSVNWFFSLPR